MVEEPNSSRKNVKILSEIIFHNNKKLSIGMNLRANENTEKVVFSATVNTNVKFLFYSGNVLYQSAFNIYRTLYFIIVPRCSILSNYYTVFLPE